MYVCMYVNMYVFRAPIISRTAVLSLPSWFRLQVLVEFLGSFLHQGVVLQEAFSNRHTKSNWVVLRRFQIAVTANAVDPVAILIP